MPRNIATVGPWLDKLTDQRLTRHENSFPPAPFRFREYVSRRQCSLLFGIDAILTRSRTRTREDVVLPLSEPVRGRDGTMIYEVPIPKDTSVFVGIYSSNTRKALWGEDAYEWKPERWLSRLPDAVMDAKIPGVYSNLCATFSEAFIDEACTERGYI